MAIDFMLRSAPELASHKAPTTGFRRLFSLFAPFILFFNTTCAAQVSDADYRTKARELFLIVERAARLPPPQQSLEIPPIYREVWPVLETEMLTSMPGFAWNGLSDLNERDLRPEELLAVYDEKGGWPIIAEAARNRCHRLLLSHAREVEGLAREDLASKERKQWHRGLRAAGEFHLAALYDVAVAQLDGPEQDFAAYALRGIDDPLAIPILVRHGVTRHFEVLRALQRNRPANTALLDELTHRDAEVRWRAAYALAESRDPHLVPTVERLARDESPKVREQAANIGFELPAEAFLRVRLVLVKFLADPAVEVRSFVVVLFASRKDPVCANALYDLLANEQTLESWRQSNLVQALDNLTGSYFGFVPGTISSPSARRVSLRQFADWMAQNVRKPR